jgi:nucleotide-binding universal stress UspA family protein
MNILLATDGSEASDAAVRQVIERPWPPGSSVRALHVLPTPFLATAYAPPPALAVGPSSPAWPPAAMEAEHRAAQAAGAMLEEIAERLARPDLTVDTNVRNGDASTEIVDEARNWPADLIVVGSRGHGGLRRLLLGSVAQAVVAHAPCSVEVARERTPER